MYKPKPKKFGMGFYSVEETGNVLVNRKGEILIPHMDGSFKIFKGTKGQYKYYGKQPIHRIVALTFLECDRDITGMVINHKDGNKHNNNVSNLEWCTYSENNNHAFRNGLRGDNRVTLLKDLTTGNITRYHSLQSCAKELSVNGAMIHWYIKGDKSRPFKGKYDVIFEGQEWSKLTDNDVIPGLEETSNRRPIYAKCIDGSDRDYVFSSVNNALSVFANEWAIRKSIKNPGLDKCAYRGYVFYYLRDYTKDKEVLERIMRESYLHLDINHNKTVVKKRPPVKYLVYRDNSISCFCNGIKEVAETVGYEHNTDSLSRYLWRNDGHINGFTVTKFKRNTSSANVDVHRKLL